MKRFLPLIVACTIFAFSSATQAAVLRTAWSNRKPPMGFVLNKDPINNGLVGWWIMNEGDGSILRDNSNGPVKTNGTFNNSPTWVNGKYGPCIHTVSASSQYVNIGAASSSLLAQGGDFTITAWAYPVTAAGNCTLFGRTQYGANFAQNYFLFIRTDEGTPFPWAFQISNNAGNRTEVKGTTAAQGNTWTHVCGVYTAATKTCSLYVNGSFIASSATTVSPDTTQSQIVSIGSYFNFANFWNGYIDDCRIYNIALTAAAIQQIYREPFRGVIAPVYRIRSGQSSVAPPFVNPPLNITILPGGSSNFLINTGGSYNFLGEMK